MTRKHATPTDYTRNARDPRAYAETPIRKELLALAQNLDRHPQWTEESPIAPELAIRSKATAIARHMSAAGLDLETLPTLILDVIAESEADIDPSQAIKMITDALLAVTTEGHWRSVEPAGNP